MIRLIKHILFGKSCKHKWEIIKEVRYTDCISLLLTCTECGKLKEREV